MSAATRWPLGYEPTGILVWPLSSGVMPKLLEAGCYLVRRAETYHSSHRSVENKLWNKYTWPRCLYGTIHAIIKLVDLGTISLLLAYDKGRAMQQWQHRLGALGKVAVKQPLHIMIVLLKIPLVRLFAMMWHIHNLL